MGKYKRKKDVVKGVLMIVFAFAVILVRHWLFPNNEAIKYIAIFIACFLGTIGSRLALHMGEEEPETSQKKEPEQVVQHEIVVTEPSWISFEKQKPEVGKRCLVYTGSCVMIARYEGADNWWTDYHSHSVPSVPNNFYFSHWMPLPSRPKEFETK